MKARVLEEEDLLDEGLLPNIDYCPHALRLADRGHLPRARHVGTCPVCLRRWRITEADLQGWAEMTHRRATALMSRMANAFATADRDERYRSFYAHLASCNRCEHRFAELTFDAAVSLPQPNVDGIGAAARPVAILR